jgi:hypothetical protein
LIDFDDESIRIRARKGILSRDKIAVVIPGISEFEVIKNIYREKMNKTMEYLKWKRGKYRINLIDVKKVNINDELKLYKNSFSIRKRENLFII